MKTVSKTLLVVASLLKLCDSGQISASSNKLNLNVGEKLHLHCKLSIPNFVNSLPILWRQNNSIITSNCGSTSIRNNYEIEFSECALRENSQSISITFNTLNPVMSGNWKCTHQNYHSNILHIKISDNFPIDISITPGVEVGTEVKLKCQPKWHTETAMVVWYFKKPSSTYIKLIAEKNMWTYSIKHANYTHVGKYKCHVKAQGTSAESRAVEIVFHFNPQPHNNASSGIRTLSGTDSKMYLLFDAYPAVEDVTCRDFFRSQSIKLRKVRENIFLFEISTLNYSDFGFYICVAINSHAKTEFYTQLNAVVAVSKIDNQFTDTKITRMLFRQSYNGTWDPIGQKQRKNCRSISGDDTSHHLLVQEGVEDMYEMIAYEITTSNTQKKGRILKYTGIGMVIVGVLLLLILSAALVVLGRKSKQKGDHPYYDDANSVANKHQQISVEDEYDYCDINDDEDNDDDDVIRKATIQHKSIKDYKSRSKLRQIELKTRFDDSTSNNTPMYAQVKKR